MQRPAIFLRLLAEKNKEAALDQTIKNNNDKRRFLLNPSLFSKVPGSPFAYWISDLIRNLFDKFPKFEDSAGIAKQGLATADDLRFVRCWWEVLPLD